MCAQRSLKSVHASTQSDYSLPCPHEETLHPSLSRMCPVKILIRLRECAGWSESSLGAHIRRYFFCRCDSNGIVMNGMCTAGVQSKLYIHVDWSWFVSAICRINGYYKLPKALQLFRLRRYENASYMQSDLLRPVYDIMSLFSRYVTFAFHIPGASPWASRIISLIISDPALPLPCFLYTCKKVHCGEGSGKSIRKIVFCIVHRK